MRILTAMVALAFHQCFEEGRCYFTSYCPLGAGLGVVSRQAGCIPIPVGTLLHAPDYPAPYLCEAPGKGAVCLVLPDRVA
jgi:hypothetical protein